MDTIAGPHQDLKVGLAKRLRTVQLFTKFLTIGKIVGKADLSLDESAKSSEYLVYVIEWLMHKLLISQSNLYIKMFERIGELGAPILNL